MSRNIVFYPREMRAFAKERGQELVTFDVLGYTFQGTCSEQLASEFLDLVLAWQKRRLAKGEDAKDGTSKV